MKGKIRNVLNFIHLDLTKNLKYDRLTKAIIKKSVKYDSNCIDVGCHKGEILDLFIKYAPKGKHFAFEPIPEFYTVLKSKYNSAKIYPFALGSEEMQTEFNYVKNAPAYSGLKERKYDKLSPNIEKLKVNVKLLDDLIQPDISIDFLKIDVEGAEYGVLKGAIKTIMNHRPFVLFEFGLGASDFYNTKPDDIFSFFQKINFGIYTLQAFLNNGKNLSLEELKNLYDSNKEYYFVANYLKNE